MTPPPTTEALAVSYLMKESLCRFWPGRALPWRLDSAAMLLLSLGHFLLESQVVAPVGSGMPWHVCEWACP